VSEIHVHCISFRRLTWRFFRDMTVTLDNVGQYTRLVCHWTLVEGVRVQMEALREGFESVFPLGSLQMFYPEELDQVRLRQLQPEVQLDFHFSPSLPGVLRRRRRWSLHSVGLGRTLGRPQA